MTETIDAQIVSNQAGTLESLHPKLKFEPIGVTLGAGFGALRIRSIDSPLLFVSPQAGYEFLTDRLHLFSNGRLTLIPKTDDSLPMNFVSYEGGGSYDLHFNNYLIRAGLSISDFTQLSYACFPQMDFGMSLIKDNYSFFISSKAVFENPVAYKQLFQDYRPLFSSSKAGFIWDMNQGSISVALSGSRSSLGLKTAFSFDSKIPIHFYTSFSRNISNLPLFGNPNEFLFGLQIEHPAGKLRIEKTSGKLESKASKSVSLTDRFFYQTIEENPTLDSLVKTVSGFNKEDLIIFASNLSRNVLELARATSKPPPKSIFKKFPGESSNADESYQAIRDYFFHGKKISAGNCANGANLVSEFLNRLGIETYSAAIQTPSGGHQIALAFNGDTGYIIDWNAVYRMKTNSIQELLSAFERDQGILIPDLILYGKGGAIRTFERTPSGILIEAASKGTTDHDPLRDSLIRKPLRR